MPFGNEHQDHMDCVFPTTLDGLLLVCTPDSGGTLGCCSLLGLWLTINIHTNCEGKHILREAVVHNDLNSCCTCLGPYALH